MKKRSVARTGRRTGKRTISIRLSVGTCAAIEAWAAVQLGKPKLKEAALRLIANGLSLDKPAKRRSKESNVNAARTANRHERLAPDVRFYSKQS